MKSSLTPRVTVGGRNTKFIFRFSVGFFSALPVLNESVILSVWFEINVLGVQGESTRAPETARQIVCRSSNPRRKGRHSHFHLCGAAAQVPGQEF